MQTSSGKYRGPVLSTIASAKLKDAPDLSQKEKNVLLEEVQAYYLQYHPAIDKAIDATLKLSDPSSKSSKIDELRASLGTAPSQVDHEQALSLLDTPEMLAAQTSAKDLHLTNFSVGLTFGFSFFFGGAIGAEYLRNLDNNKNFLRGYAVATAGLDIFLGVGINIGLWTEQPPITQSSSVEGIILDVRLKVPVRIMFIRQGSKAVGMSVAALFGGGALIAGFSGVQYVLGIPPLRTSLTVENCTDGTNPSKPGTATIAQNVPSILKLILKNTSKQKINIPSQAEMRVSMPDIFTNAELNNSTLSAPRNWNVDTWTGTREMTLTYTGNGTFGWEADKSLVLTLSNLATKSASSKDGPVTMIIPDAVPEAPTVDRDGVFAGATLTLVPDHSYATITEWSTSLKTFTLVDGYTSAGTFVPAVTQANSSDVVTLAEVIDENLNVWILGYQFFIDEASDLPYFRAVWKKENTRKVFAPSFSLVTTNAAESTAAYEDLPGNDSITISLKLNS